MSQDNGRAEARTLAFVVLSSFAHVAMVVGLMNLDISPDKQDVVEIEILSSPGVTQAPIVDQPPVKMIEPKIAPAPQAPILAKEDKQETVVSKPAPTKSLPTKMVAQTQTAAVAQPSAQPVIAKPAPQEVAAVLPDVANTDLSQPEETPAKPELKDEDIADDLQKVDQKMSEDHQTKIAAIHEALDKDADEEMKAQEAKTAELKKQNDEAAKRMAKANADRRNKEREALAASQAQAAAAAAAEKAAQDGEEANQAAAAEQAAQAREAKLAEEAQAAEAKHVGELASNTQKENLGNGGDGEVRDLGDLKQMPGNQRPQYDTDDRMNGRQGEVAFIAYVSKDGAITQFKMAQSSGHRQLDAKTLKAIKEWKFYPGQEGWVEIPFRWDLKGGVQPVGPILRTKKVSQSAG